MACGRTTLSTVWKRVAPERQRGLAHLARDGAQRLLGGHDDHRQVESASVSAAQISAGWPHTIRRRRRPDRSPRPTNWMKKPRPNRPKTMRGHAGQVVHRDPHHPRQARVRARVLVQVDRGRHADRDERDRHEQHQRHRAEDGGEDAARRHALARRRGEEVPGQRAARRTTRCSTRIATRITIRMRSVAASRRGPPASRSRRRRAPCRRAWRCATGRAPVTRASSPRPELDAQALDRAAHRAR